MIKKQKTDNTRLKRFMGLGVFLLVGGACLLVPLQGAMGQQAKEKGGFALKIPFGLEDPGSYVPADNPLTADKVELGRLLFFDKRLSKDNSIACASCHMPGVATGAGNGIVL